MFTNLDYPFLDSSVTPYLLLLLRAGCLTRLSLRADGLIDGFLGRSKERIRGNLPLLLVLYESAVSGGLSSPCTETRLDLYQIIVGGGFPLQRPLYPSTSSQRQFDPQPANPTTRASWRKWKPLELVFQLLLLVCGELWAGMTTAESWARASAHKGSKLSAAGALLGGARWVRSDILG